MAATRDHRGEAFTHMGEEKTPDSTDQDEAPKETPQDGNDDGRKEERGNGRDVRRTSTQGMTKHNSNPYKHEREGGEDNYMGARKKDKCKLINDVRTGNRTWIGRPGPMTRSMHRAQNKIDQL